MKRYLPLVIIAVIAAAIGVGAASINKQDTGQKTISPASGPSTGQNGSSASSKTGQPPVASGEVAIEDMAFRPGNITVKKGTTVAWTNKDDVGHTISSRSPDGPNSGILNKNQSYSFTFNNAGEFSYFCEVHPTMTAKVTVTE